jgi:hemolysin activation/secretion protein
LALAGCLLAIAVAAPSRAQIMNQSYDQFAPKPVPPLPRESKEKPEQEIKKTGGSPDDVLLPELKGLVFVGHPDDIEKQGLEFSAPVVFAKKVEVPEPEKFKATVEPFVGKQLTRGKLNELITVIITHYRKYNHPVIDVIVPEQDINAGVVQVLLLESRVNDVKVTGNRWFSSNEIRDDFRVKKGDRIIASDMLADISWANQNPFHTSDVIYQPGPEIGTTDVVLQTKDRFPVRFYAGYEDSGNAQTGLDRYITGFNWGDAWGAGLGHQLNYQYTTSNDFDGLQAHSGSYVIPLPWHHTLTFFGDYVTTKGEIPPVISLEGLSYQISGRYTVPLPSIGDYKHNLSGGFDYKYNDNSLQFGNVPLSASPIEVEQFVLSYDSSLRDNWGITSFGVQGYFSPGNWWGYNSDAAFNDSHTYATSNYDYANINISRLTRLPWDWSLFLKGTFQVSDSNLTPSEQMGFGGYDTIRGYDSGVLNTDEGYIFNVELRTPSVSFGEALGCPQFQDQLQFLFFWDYGSGFNHTLLPGEPSDTTLSSIGVGLRYTINTYLSLRFDYGFQLYQDPQDNNHGNRGDIGLTFSY